VNKICTSLSLTQVRVLPVVLDAVLEEALVLLLLLVDAAFDRLF
jgi:hypothetical protein